MLWWIDRSTLWGCAVSAPPPAALDELARTLFDELARGEFNDSVWDDLDEGQKEFYRGCIQGLIVRWESVLAVHAYLTGVGEPPNDDAVS